MISLPILIGAALLRRLLKKPPGGAEISLAIRLTDNTVRFDLISFAVFFGPLTAVIAMQSVLYDGWRHMFFLYVPFCLIALRGYTGIFQAVSHLQFKKEIFGALVMALFAGLLPIIIFLRDSHPYQNIYFNALAGKNLQQIKARFPLDYWGLSYREGLEKLLKLDKRRRIHLLAANFAAKGAVQILPASSRERVRFVKSSTKVPFSSTEALTLFLRNRRKFYYSKRYGKLLIRGRMSNDERDELLEIAATHRERRAVQRLYQNSQSLAWPHYFITNYRNKRGGYQRPLFFSIVRDGARMMSIYRL